MVNYKVQMSKNGMYEIIETLTNNRVAQNLDIHQAKASCRHLNFGGGEGIFPGPYICNVVDGVRFALTGKRGVPLRCVRSAGEVMTIEAHA